MTIVRRKSAILLAGGMLALAACSSGDGETQVTSTVEEGDSHAVQALTPVDAPPEIEAPALAAVARVDIEAELEPGAGCSVEQDGKSLLVAVEGDAIARPYGTLRHFAFAGDLDALWDGGEFTAGAITIVVTPEDGEGEQIDTVTVKQASVRVREDGQEGEAELRAEWHCGA
ncbi:hypothetical protein [Parasphingopyxis marina]|uniref:Lipoprotein n=1 Tax=Parasphingopyxis marina TaxID=2761622 RepID=A0A842HVV3_9SPHN|nr:hypothetical protein [Parasphingopyxis marina]MBC2778188.1 hypothetical protein [Parasphingopyxis marina]